MSANQKGEYDPVFNGNAVLLTEEQGRSVKNVSDSVGIHPDLIDQWRKRLQDQGEIITIQYPENIC